MPYLLRYILLPNLIFFILSLVITFNRAWLNLDYCLVGIVSPVIGRYWAAGLYLILFLLDIVATFAPTYHLQPVILLTIFRELSAFNPINLVMFAVLLVTPLICMWYFAFNKEKSTQKSNILKQRQLLFIVPVILIILDIINGSNTLLRIGEIGGINHNIAGSVLVKTTRDIKNKILKRTTTPQLLYPQQFATSNILQKNHSSPANKQNIVLVIVESWGISSDLTLNQRIISSFFTKKITSRYSVKTGHIPFHGATVSAELRELYGFRASDPHDLSAITSLPDKLSALGYKTIALHGFMPVFFGRNEWYPQAGFEQSYFVDELDKLISDHSKCGSSLFRGTCDDRVPFVIKQMLHRDVNKPKFIYWLTLNSHYPFAYPEKESDFSCDQFPLSKQHKHICNLSSTIYSTLSAIAEIVSDSDIPPTHFIIVGDHSPPVLMRSKEGLYDNKYVPMIELNPK